MKNINTHLTSIFMLLQAGIVAANIMLNKSYDILNNPNLMVLSSMEAGARSLIVKFLQNYITLGTLILIEEGGTVFKFEGSKKESSLKVHLKVHNPQFYWKVSALNFLLAISYNVWYSVVESYPSSFLKLNYYENKNEQF
ncbi:putative arsenite methyltransferase [Helianthus annuus]|nr:putative arsenite methyltransferase [Helianthus annuus]